MPQFSADWFSIHIPKWRAIFRAAGWDPSQPKTVIEIGSFEGRSTLWMLENLLPHPDSRIHCIDTFGGSVEHASPNAPPGMRMGEDIRGEDGLFHRFMGNLAETPGRQKATVYRKSSFAGLVQIFGTGIRADFIYIDGSHAAPDVLSDCVLAFQLLKPGGLMIFDDYIWQMEPRGSEDVLNSPKIAIDAFVNIFRRKIRFLPEQNLLQLALIKTAD